MITFRTFGASLSTRWNNSLSWSLVQFCALSCARYIRCPICMCSSNRDRGDSGWHFMAISTRNLYCCWVNFLYLSGDMTIVLIKFLKRGSASSACSRSSGSGERKMDVYREGARRSASALFTSRNCLMFTFKRFCATISRSSRGSSMLIG